MKRSFNFTGLKILDKNLIKLSVEEKEIPWADQTIVYPVIKEIAVKTANFPGDSRIFLRLKRNEKVKTLECGTIRYPKPPDEGILREFSLGTKVSISGTVAIKDPEKNNILAVNKGLIPIFKSKNVDSKSPFALEAFDTGSTLWKMDSMDESNPYLTILISKEISLIGKFQNDERYLSLILPQALKGAITYMIDNDCCELRDDESWVNTIIKMLSYIDCPIDRNTLCDSDGNVIPDEKNIFLEKAVDAWSSKTKDILFDKAISKINHQDEE
tara:strand:+ start:197 stop:1009 length:813 start_codon:yes stop_codon:yes gene_type:complete